MRFATVNPVNNELQKSYPQHRIRKVKSMVRKAVNGFAINKTSPLLLRSRRMHALADQLIQKKQYYAQLITTEMGKPIKQSLSEVEKCAWVCRYYADNAKFFLAREEIQTDYAKSYVSYQPMGVILAIMPWNFPFWQVFRFAAPALMAGNAFMLKHAPNVPQCARAIADSFRFAGFPDGIVQHLYIDHKKVKLLIEDENIAALTFTGSTIGGAKVAELAGKNIKKIVLELGGSDPFIVLDDANVKEAAKIAVRSRMLNAGQSCIAAKRFIVMADVFNDFLQSYIYELKQLTMGNPIQENCDIGPLAREDLAKNVARQVAESVKMGAEIVIGGGRPKVKGAYYNPTVLTNITPEMPVFTEEVFGPVAAMIQVSSVHEAIDMANKTEFGLGASIWTSDAKKAERLSRQIDTGNVFINAMVASDPRLPFGGIKQSGYGRELSSFGIREFVNAKTIVVA